MWPPSCLGLLEDAQRYFQPVSILFTLGATLISGVIAALIAIWSDNLRGSRTRRLEGEIALRDFQRVLADMSSYLLMADAVIDETPLEKLEWKDLAESRRSAYRFKDLLPPEDQYLLVRSSVPYDLNDELFYDSRQPAVNDWALKLDAAIDRAFSPRLRRWRRRRASRSTALG